MRVRLSRPKLHRLANLVVETVQKEPGAKLHGDPQELRWKVFNWIQQILELDDAIDQKVRRRIARTRPHLPPGSDEWQVLYQQYYNEEIQGFGKYRR